MKINLIEVKNYLRVTANNDDKLIEEMMKAAISFAENFIGYNLTIFNTEIPFDLKMGLYAHIALFYDNRGSSNPPSESLNIYKKYRKILI